MCRAELRNVWLGTAELTQAEVGPRRGHVAEGEVSLEGTGTHFRSCCCRSQEAQGARRCREAAGRLSGVWGAQ